MGFRRTCFLFIILFISLFSTLQADWRIDLGAPVLYQLEEPEVVFDTDSSLEIELRPTKSPLGGTLHFQALSPVGLGLGYYEQEVKQTSGDATTDNLLRIKDKRFQLITKIIDLALYFPLSWFHFSLGGGVGTTEFKCKEECSDLEKKETYFVPIHQYYGRISIPVVVFSSSFFIQTFFSYQKIIGPMMDLEEFNYKLNTKGEIMTLGLSFGI